MEQLGNLHDPAALPCWLATTTGRECARVLRAAHHPQAAALLPDPGHLADEHAELPEQELLAAKQHATLRAALTCLPPRGQQLLTLLTCDPPMHYTQFDPATGESLGTLAERWDGRTWRIVPTFKPAPTGPNAALYGVACTSASACTAVGNQTLAKTLAERWNGHTWQVQATPNPAGAQNITLASVACPARTACTAFGLNHIGSSPLTLAERWSGGRWRIQPTPGLVAVDSGSPVGVACPNASACYAVGAYTNNGPTFANLTLAEQWTPTGTSVQAATGRPVAPGALPAACLRARMPGSLPISGRSPAVAWSRFRAGSFPGRAGSPSPASRIWCGTG